MKYFPKFSDISKEAIKYGVVLIVVAFVISKSEKLKKLIKENL